MKLALSVFLFTDIKTRGKDRIGWIVFKRPASNIFEDISLLSANESTNKQFYHGVNAK